MTPYPGTKPSQALPLPARFLAVAGLIPLVLGALAIGFSPEIKPEAARGLLLYGAVILSFFGGIRWGIALLEGDKAGWSAYGLSIAPPLVAWLGAVTVGPLGLLILAAAFGLWLFVERAAPPSLALPSGYMRLRSGLTLIAVLSLVAAAFSW
ncbi:MAG: DUF3429 domain-containing protein [Rhodomicrobium sp.]